MDPDISIEVIGAISDQTEVSRGSYIFDIITLDNCIRYRAIFVNFQGSIGGKGKKQGNFQFTIFAQWVKHHSRVIHTPVL